MHDLHCNNTRSPGLAVALGLALIRCGPAIAEPHTPDPKDPGDELTTADDPHDPHDSGVGDEDTDVMCVPGVMDCPEDQKCYLSFVFILQRCVQAV